MSRPRLLDAFCGAGGATRGYQLAGFHVTGVDHKPQPRYVGDEFHQGDAIAFIREDGHAFDAIHASPPCERYATVTRWRGRPTEHPDLVAPVRDALVATGVPWVIENVPAAPIRADLILCGSHFGLRVIRHRWFETSWRCFLLVPACDHRDYLPFEHKAERAYADAMGCTWMNKTEARDAIPPAYTEFIGRQLLAALAHRRTA